MSNMGDVSKIFEKEGRLFTTHSRYRMVSPAGSKIPETVVGEFHCNTKAAGWLNGAHPTVNVSRISQKLVLTHPHIVENRGISMAPLVLRLIS